MIKVIHGFPNTDWYFPITNLWVNELWEFEKKEYPGFTHILGAEIIYCHKGAPVHKELQVIADNLDELKQFIKEHKIIDRLKGILNELSILDIPT